MDCDESNSSFSEAVENPSHAELAICSSFKERDFQVEHVELALRIADNLTLLTNVSKHDQIRKELQRPFSLPHPHLYAAYLHPSL